VKWILVIFQYVAAYIILCSKNPASVQTVLFWPKMSSQSATRDLQDYCNYQKGKLPEFYATGSRKTNNWPPLTANMRIPAMRKTSPGQYVNVALKIVLKIGEEMMGQNEMTTPKAVIIRAVSSCRTMRGMNERKPGEDAPKNTVSPAPKIYLLSFCNVANVTPRFGSYRRYFQKITS
jgi:hypothetical protein